MKRLAAWLLAGLLVFSLFSCTAKKADVVRTYEDSFVPYEELSDGTWRAKGHTYQYRLEITGRMSNAACDSTFVYLSNLPSISFDRAWKAAGLSSNMEDYFNQDEAVLVEMR